MVAGLQRDVFLFKLKLLELGKSVSLALYY